jgi:hypothetical protein
MVINVILIISYPGFWRKIFQDGRRFFGGAPIFHKTAQKPQFSTAFYVDAGVKMTILRPSFLGKGTQKPDLSGV